MITRLSHMAAVLLSVVLLTSLGESQQPKKAASPQDPCEQVRREAFLEGFTGAHELQQRLTSTSLSQVARPLPIQILAEQIDGSDSYRFRAAEVVRTHFARYLKVEPEATLYLHIRGTNRDGTRETAQYVAVAVEAHVVHRFLAGEHGHNIMTPIQFSTKGSMLLNYSSQETTQAVEEMVYAVLNDFLGKWNKGREKTD